MSYQFKEYTDNQIRRAIPTDDPNDATGVYELPLANSVIKKGVNANSWARHKPTAHNISLFQGDVIRSIRKFPDHINWYVTEINDTEVTLAPINSPTNDEITRDRDKVIIAIEAERDKTEKVASHLSKSEADYLFGTANEESGITAKFTNPSPKGSVSDLILTRERSAETVSKFINHPIISHTLGRNYDAKRITFGARYQSKDGSIAGIVDLTYPSAPALDGEQIIEIKRFATHPWRPENTGSWLISKALEWAQLEAFEKVISYAGIGGNEGVLYRALEFDDSKYATEQSDGGGWAAAEGRENRSTWEDYERNRYDKSLYDDCPVHRREVPKSLRTSSQQGFDNFEPADTTPLLSVHEDTAEGLSLSDPTSPLWFARRENNSELLTEAISHYGNQASGDLQETDVAFAAVTDGGTVAALCASTPSKTEDPITIVGFGSAQPNAKTNTAAILTAKLRKWAGLCGYTSLTAQPKAGTELESALTQCGFTTMTSTAKTPIEA